MTGGPLPLSFPALAALLLVAAPALAVTVNDVQSQMNATDVHRVVTPTSLADIQAAVKLAARDGRAVSIAGGRHAMGGQQFGNDTLHIDMSRMTRVLRFDRKRGIIHVEAGIQWPELIGYLLDVQKGDANPWGIAQKQTGADRLSIGGALSANIHGRGLKMKPMIADVESFVLVNADGRAVHCSRTKNRDLFNLTIGGYGLFGVIASAEIRLVPRLRIERVVEVIDVKDLARRFEERIRDGYIYGDFQYSTDRDGESFMRQGVFSCYRPAPSGATAPETPKELTEQDWRDLYYLAHADRKAAWNQYSSHYLATTGQIYWSDTHQLSLYVDDYHADVSRKMGIGVKATEMITEIDVPRADHAAFMNDVRDYARKNKVEIIYGTVRLIEQDDEAVLTWARKPWACTIFNLHVDHTPDGFEKAERDFRALTELGLKYGGSYFLTYHRFATKDQVMRAHPRMVEFLKAKKRFDPAERFQSDWYRYYRSMFAPELGATQ